MPCQWIAIMGNPNTQYTINRQNALNDPPLLQLCPVDKRFWSIWKWLSHHPFPSAEQTEFQPTRAAWIFEVRRTRISALFCVVRNLSAVSIWVRFSCYRSFDASSPFNRITSHTNLTSYWRGISASWLGQRGLLNSPPRRSWDPAQASKKQDNNPEYQIQP